MRGERGVGNWTRTREGTRKGVRRGLGVRERKGRKGKEKKEERKEESLGEVMREFRGIKKGEMSEQKEARRL